jgi:hypothetical protein
VVVSGDRVQAKELLVVLRALGGGGVPVATKPLTDGQVGALW